jgi:hypothetical protein
MFTKLSTEENIERVKLLKECYNEYNTTMKQIKDPRILLSSKLGKR